MVEGVGGAHTDDAIACVSHSNGRRCVVVSNGVHATRRTIGTLVGSNLCGMLISSVGMTGAICRVPTRAFFQCTAPVGSGNGSGSGRWRGSAVVARRVRRIGGAAGRTVRTVIGGCQYVYAVSIDAFSKGHTVVGTQGATASLTTLKSRPLAIANICIAPNIHSRAKRGYTGICLFTGSNGACFDRSRNVCQDILSVFSVFPSFGIPSKLAIIIGRATLNNKHVLGSLRVG